MKAWMLFPFMLLIGWMLGGWIPKSELRRVREELKTARMALKDRAPRSGGFGGVTGMLGIPETAETGEDPGEADAPGNGDSTTNALVTPVAVVTNDAATNAVSEAGEAAPDPARERRSMKQGIEQAMEVWQARADIAHSTFVTNVGLDQEQANRFQVLVTAMNLRLAHTIEEFAQTLQEGGTMDEEMGVKLMRDMTTSIATTYDELDGSMPENWREDSGKKFSLTDFVDPAVALPLVDVEDKIDGRGGFFGNR